MVDAYCDHHAVAVHSLRHTHNVCMFISIFVLSNFLTLDSKAGRGTTVHSSNSPLKWQSTIRKYFGKLTLERRHWEQPRVPDISMLLPEP